MKSWRLDTLFFLIPLVLLLISHLGALHPLGDSLAVFRGPLIIIAAVAWLSLLAQRSWRLVMVGGALVLWSAYGVLTVRFDGVLAADAPYALYQKNMLFSMPSVNPLVADILSDPPDFITLQEVSRRNRAILAALAKPYPAQVLCSSPTIAEVAVLSRWPKIAGSDLCLADLGFAAMQLETPDGPVWLVSIHLDWPYPYRQEIRVQRLLPHLRSLDGPVVLGGDFNMVPWSHTVRAISRAAGTQRIGGVKDTFQFFDGEYTLPIDHILVNINAQPAQTSKRPLFGSDHHGLLARFYIR